MHAVDQPVDDSPSGRSAGRRSHSATSVFMVVAFAFVVAALSCRAITKLNVPGSPDGSNWALEDFRDAIYYPAVELLSGGNPYDADVYFTKYPVSRPLAAYSPLLLLLHLPFALLPFAYSEFVYYVWTILLTLVVAHLSRRLCGLPASWSHVCGLAALILVTRPGQMNLLLGQSTLELVIMTYLALEYARTRPWLAGFSLALSTFKPTYGFALALLMLCRRDTRAVAIGMMFAALLSLIPALLLVRAAGGIRPFGASLLSTLQGFSARPDWFNGPLTGPFRIDTPALVQRLTGVEFGTVGELILGLVILGFGAIVVRRLDRGDRDTAGQLSITVVCLTVLTCAYHQAYDLLLLALPVTGLIADRWIPRSTDHPRLRWWALALLALPAVNYLASATSIEALHITTALWIAVTSLNAAMLLLALALYGGLSFQRRGERGNA